MSFLPLTQTSVKARAALPAFSDWPQQTLSRAFLDATEKVVEAFRRREGQKAIAITSIIEAMSDYPFLSSPEEAQPHTLGALRSLEALGRLAILPLAEVVVPRQPLQSVLRGVVRKVAADRRHAGYIQQANILTLPSVVSWLEKTAKDPWEQTVLIFALMDEFVRRGVAMYQVPGDPCGPTLIFPGLFGTRQEWTGRVYWDSMYFFTADLSMVMPQLVAYLESCGKGYRLTSASGLSARFVTDKNYPFRLVAARFDRQNSIVAIGYDGVKRVTPLYEVDMEIKRFMAKRFRQSGCVLRINCDHHENAFIEKYTKNPPRPWLKGREPSRKTKLEQIDGVWNKLRKQDGVKVLNLMQWRSADPNKALKLDEIRDYVGNYFKRIRQYLESQKGGRYKAADFPLDSLVDDGAAQGGADPFRDEHRLGTVAHPPYVDTDWGRVFLPNNLVLADLSYRPKASVREFREAAE